MTSYAMHLTARGCDGREARVCAVAPSPAAARALIDAYRDVACLGEVDIPPAVPFDAAQAQAAGLDYAPGISRLFCLIRDAQADETALSLRPAA